MDEVGGIGGRDDALGWFYGSARLKVAEHLIHEVGPIPWPEEGAGADDQGLRMDGGDAPLGLGFALPVHAARADGIALQVRAAEAPIEDSVGREGDDRQPEAGRGLSDGFGSGGVGPEAQVPLTGSVVDPNIARRIDDGPRAISRE